MRRRIIALSVFFLVISINTAFANPDSVVVPGDLRITGLGSGLVFPDGSVQYQATIQGPSGPQGPTGPAITLSIGTVNTGASGSLATATITGTAPNQVLNLTVPQGPKGDTGVAAIQGTIDGNLVGSWNFTSFPQSGASSTGVITFNSDGSFSLDNQSLSIMAFCSGAMTGKWKSQKESVIQTQIDGYETSTQYVNGSWQAVQVPCSIVYPMVVSMSSTKIVLERFGNVAVLEK